MPGRRGESVSARGLTISVALHYCPRLMDSYWRRAPSVPRLFWHPDVADGLVLEDATGQRWVVARPLTSNALRPFDGDRSLLEPIAAIGHQAPGQLGVDVVGVAEIAARAGVSRNAVQKWRDRHDDFPEPMATLAAGPVWSWEAVERWLRIRRLPGRPTLDALSDRAWSAVEAALPPEWEAAIIATGDPAVVIAEASHLPSRAHIKGHGSTTPDALFDLARALRQFVAGQQSTS